MVTRQTTHITSQQKHVIVIIFVKAINVMVTVIKKNASHDKIAAAIKKIPARKGMDAFKYCGVITLKESPLAIQKKMRDEWK